MIYSILRKELAKNREGIDELFIQVEVIDIDVNFSFGKWIFDETLFLNAQALDEFILEIITFEKQRYLADLKNQKEVEDATTL